MANLGYLQLVRHCDQYCRFCSNPATGGALDLAAARRQIDELAARGYFGVILTGGEPSLSEIAPEVAAYAVGRGLHVRMISNGSRLADPDRVARLLAAGCRHFHISVQSLEPGVHDFLAGTAGSLERALAALARLGAAGAVVDVNTVINAFNADHLDRTVRGLVDRFPFVGHYVWNNLDPSMGRAECNRDTAHRLADLELSLARAMRFLARAGKSFRVERVPLCYMTEFAHCSTETRKIVKGEERIVHFLDAKGTVRQTDFVHAKAEVCRACSLDPICGGLFDLGDHYDRDELHPVFVDPAAVVARITG
jgi:MoaA/NifB/PqqE/SkfB family radical SAM enzyme